MEQVTRCNNVTQEPTFRSELMHKSELYED
jgi:hypothetical protein